MAGDPPLEVLKKAMEFAHRFGDYRLGGDIAVSIALHLIREEQFEKAQRMLFIARRLYERDHRPDTLEHGRIRIMEAQGLWAWQQGKKQQALKTLQLARQFTRENYPYLLYRIDTTLSELMERERNLQDSLAYAREAYNAAAAAKFHRDRVEALQRLYHLYRKLGDLKRAYQMLEAALVVARRFSHEPQLIENLSKLMEELKRVYKPKPKKEEASTPQ